MYNNNFEYVSTDNFVEACRGKKIIVYGNSSRIENALKTFLKGNVDYICDSNDENWGRKRNDIDICGPSRLENEKMDDIVIYSVLKDYNVLLSYYKKIGVKDYYFDDIFFSEEYFEYFGMNGKLTCIAPYEKKYKYVDIITDDKFIVPLVELLEDHFDISEHLFVIHAINIANYNNRFQLWEYYLNLSEKYHNVLILDNIYNLSQLNILDKFKILKINIENCEKLVLHNGFWRDDFQTFLSNNSELLKGKNADLLIWAREIMYEKNDKFEKIYQSIKRIIAEKSFYEIFKDRYNLNTNVLNDRLYQGYCYYRKSNFVNVPHKSINVLIGNSAIREYKHLEVLDDLRKYKDKDITIICPLNYGDMNYAEEIKEYGKQLFGDKFKSIDKYISYDEYPAVLSGIDIALLPTERRCGANTVRLLLALGKKIYLSNMENWNSFIEKGFCLFDYAKIKEDDYDTFIQKEIGYARNKDLASGFLNGKEVVEEWHKIYNL